MVRYDDSVDLRDEGVLDADEVHLLDSPSVLQKLARDAGINPHRQGSPNALCRWMLMNPEAWDQSDEELTEFVTAVVVATVERDTRARIESAIEDAAEHFRVTGIHVADDAMLDFFEGVEVDRSIGFDKSDHGRQRANPETVLPDVLG